MTITEDTNHIQDILNQLHQIQAKCLKNTSYNDSKQTRSSILLEVGQASSTSVLSTVYSPSKSMIRSQSDPEDMEISIRHSMMRKIGKLHPRKLKDRIREHTKSDIAKLDANLRHRRLYSWITLALSFGRLVSICDNIISNLIESALELFSEYKALQLQLGLVSRSLRQFGKRTESMPLQTAGLRYWFMNKFPMTREKTTINVSSIARLSNPLPAACPSFSDSVYNTYETSSQAAMYESSTIPTSTHHTMQHLIENDSFTPISFPSNTCSASSTGISQETRYATEFTQTSLTLSEVNTCSRYYFEKQITNTTNSQSKPSSKTEYSSHSVLDHPKHVRNSIIKSFIEPQSIDSMNWLVIPSPPLCPLYYDKTVDDASDKFSLSANDIAIAMSDAIIQFYRKLLHCIPESVSEEIPRLQELFRLTDKYVLTPLLYDVSDDTRPSRDDRVQSFG